MPVHPDLVLLLRDHLMRHETGQARAAACTGLEAASLLARRRYHLRHAAVSTWLNAEPASCQGAAG